MQPSKQAILDCLNVTMTSYLKILILYSAKEMIKIKIFRNKFSFKNKNSFMFVHTTPDSLFHVLIKQMDFPTMPPVHKTASTALYWSPELVQALGGKLRTDRKLNPNSVAGSHIINKHNMTSNIWEGLTQRASVELFWHFQADFI